MKKTVAPDRSKKIKTAWRLAALTVLFLCVYIAAVKLNFIWIQHIYVISAAVLILVYFVVNGGFSSVIPKDDELPEDWSAVERCDYLEKMKARHEKAKILLLFIFPLLFTIFLDTVYLFFFTGK